MPITIKSKTDQFTSLVNCMAMNGISNRERTISRMVISLLFFVFIVLDFRMYLFVIYD